jgi:type IV pilus assembly protein PilB
VYAPTEQDARLGAGLRERLGEILVRKGRIDRHQLEQALAEIRLTGERLGRYLVRIGLVFEDDIAHGLATQYGLPYIELDPHHLDFEVAKELPESVSRRLLAVPVRSTEDSLVVAIADPTDLFATDELRMAIDRDIQAVVATESAIRGAIETIHTGVPYYAPSSGAPTTDERTTSIDRHLEEESTPAVELVNAILRRAIAMKASDVHFLPRRDNMIVRVRVDGVMRELQSVPAEFRSSVSARLKVMGQLDIAERRLPQDGRVAIQFDGTQTDLRIAVLPTTHGEEIVLRILYLEADDGLTTFDQLGLEGAAFEDVRDALAHPSGAIVVCGPTGSGKTTTLYAALRELNNGARSIVTIEDPVEANLDSVAQIEINTKAGLTFARGLRTILRADPDVILVGEVRDLETAEIAMRAAMTGHMVLTTMHAEDTAAALVQLCQLGLQATIVSSAVRCIVAQRLLRRPCPRCGSGDTVPIEIVERAGLDARTSYPRPRGCSHCDMTGYAGRVAAYEVLSVDRVRDLVGQPSVTIARAARDAGIRSLREHALALCSAGETTLDEVIRVTGLKPLEA